MAKLSNYKGSVNLISGLIQKNNGEFPLAEANAIMVAEDGTRLDAKLESMDQSIAGKSASTHVHDVATQSKNGFFSSSDKKKLDEIDENANNYTHPSHTAYAKGLYKIQVDGNGHIISATVVAKSDITGLGIPAQDTVYTHPDHTAYVSGLYKVTVDDEGHVTGAVAVAKSDITALGIPGTNTTYNKATSSADGLMAKEDKAKLDTVESNANNYTHPDHTSYASGLYKITVDGEGHITGAVAVTKTDITGLGIPGTNTTYNKATTSADGLMSKEDKAIVDGLHTVASSGSYNDLENKPSIPSASNATPAANGTAKAGSGTTWARADHVHPLQTSVAKLTTARNISITGGATAAAKSFDGSAAIELNITSIDGSKITGTIPLSAIPKGAQERMIPVANDTARLALTSSDAQNGDVVKVESTGIMYYVVDDTKLGSEAAFSVFTAGAASSVDWSGITNKPTFAAVAESGAYSDLSGVPTAATTSKDGLMSKDDKAKLNGIATGANKYVHPSYTAKESGLYKVTIDSEGHVSATTAVAKADITALGIPGTNTTYNKATTSADGLMAKEDKAKLDGIDANANNYAHPSHTAKTADLYKVTVDGEGHVSAATKVVKSDITALGIPAQDTTYSKVTTSADGLMSKEDKSKLDGVATGANKTVVDTAMSSSSTNPVQNKVVNTALNAKATTATYNATIGTAWTGDVAPYTQIITVSGITANDNPIVDCVLNNSDLEINKKCLEDYSKIYRITTAANSITVYALEPTEAAVPIQIKCIR